MTVAWQKREYYAREWSDVVKLRSRVRLLLAFVGLNHTRLFPLLKCCMFFPLVFQLVLKDANLKYFLPKVMKSGYELTWVYSKISLSPFVFVLFCFFLLKFGRKMCFSYNLADDIVISPVYLYWVILQFSFPFLFALISSLFKPSNYCPPPVVLHFYRLVLHRNFKQNHTLARTALDKNNVSRQKQWYARFLWTLISEVINLSNYYPRFYFQRNTKLPSILWNGWKVTNWFKKFLLSFVHDAGHNLHFPVNSFSKSVSIDV